jgi:hypothetical protein
MDALPTPRGLRGRLMATIALPGSAPVPVLALRPTRHPRHFSGEAAADWLHVRLAQARAPQVDRCAFFMREPGADDAMQRRGPWLISRCLSTQALSYARCNLGG